MVTINFRNKLIDIAKLESNDSKIAKVLAYYYPSLNLSGRDKLFESLLEFYKMSENQELDFQNILDKLKSDEKSFDVSKFKGKDFRIRNIEISNLRGIPNKDKDEIPFGLNLVEEGIVNNAVILANNGVGKSSIFAGLEMIFAQEIGERNIRTKNYESFLESDYRNYITRFPFTGKPVCKIDTIDKNYDLENVIFTNKDLIKVFNPNNFFISDFDIYENGKVQFTGNDKEVNSLHSILAKSLGLEEYINLQNLLLQIPSYKRLKESNKRNALERDINEKNIFIKNSKVEIQSKTIEINELKENQSKGAKSTIAKFDKLNNLRAKDFKTEINIDEYEESISTFNIAYNNYLSKVKNKKGFFEKNFLEAGKELLHDFDNCPFCLNSKKSLEEIQKDVEKRLAKLKEIQNLDLEIKNAFRDLSNLLWKSISELNRFYEAISKERSELTEFPNFFELNEREGNIYVKLSPIINDNDLNDYVYSFTQKLLPAEKDYEDLYNLINKNSTLFQNFYPENFKLLNYLSKDREILIEKEIELLNKDKALTVEQKVKNITEEIEKITEQIAQTEKQITQSQKEFEEAKKNADLVEVIKEQVKAYNIKYSIEINNIVNEVFEPIKDVVETIMKDYFQDDKENYFQLQIKKVPVIIDDVELEDKYIVAEIINKKTKESTTPDIYFNTFRYKLFCLMISLSIALATRKKYDLNLPLIMDDLFYSSDFINKNSFSKFLQKVIQQFNKHTPHLPLQFILFTHDDLIFTSTLDAIETFQIESNDLYCDENKKELIEKTIIGRIFRPNEKDEIHSEFSNGKKYWNLLYKLPKNINQLTNV